MLECDSGVVVVVVVVVVEALVSLLRYWLRFCPLDVDGIIVVAEVVVGVGDSHVGGAGGRAGGGLASGGGRAGGGRAGGGRAGGGGRQ